MLYRRLTRSDLPYTRYISLLYSQRPGLALHSLNVQEPLGSPPECERANPDRVPTQIKQLGLPYPSSVKQATATKLD